MSGEGTQATASSGGARGIRLATGVPATSAPLRIRPPSAWVMASASSMASRWKASSVARGRTAGAQHLACSSSSTVSRQGPVRRRTSEAAGRCPAPAGSTAGRAGACAESRGERQRAGVGLVGLLGRAGRTARCVGQRAEQRAPVGACCRRAFPGSRRCRRIPGCCAPCKSAMTIRPPELIQSPLFVPAPG